MTLAPGPPLRLQSSSSHSLHLSRRELGGDDVRQTLGRRSLSRTPHGGLRHIKPNHHTVLVHLRLRISISSIHLIIELPRMRHFTTSAIRMSQRVGTSTQTSHQISTRTPNTNHSPPSKIQFKVTGKVQGVCFRSFTAEKAEGFKLTGHVKNESDGSVSRSNATFYPIVQLLIESAGYWRSTRRQGLAEPIRAALAQRSICGQGQQCRAERYCD